MNFQDDMPSISIGNFEDHYVLVVDLTSRQDDTENCFSPELIGEPLRLELNFTLPLEHVTELMVLAERMTNLVLLESTSKMDNVALQQIIDRIPLFKYRYLSSFPLLVMLPRHLSYVRTFPNDTFVMIKTQLSNIRDGHWILIANTRYKLFFADSLGRKKYSSLKQHYKQ